MAEQRRRADPCQEFTHYGARVLGVRDHRVGDAVDGDHRLRDRSFREHQPVEAIHDRAAAHLERADLD